MLETVYKNIVWAWWNKIIVWFRGVMVNTLDFESRDPSSSLGGAYKFL